MRTFYLQYLPISDINYLYLFLLYSIAEVNPEDKAKGIYLYNTVQYESIAELATRLNDKYGTITGFTEQKAVSVSTLRRVLQNGSKDGFFLFNNIERTIILENNFIKSANKEEKKPFVTLSEAEVKILLENNDKLLYRYYLYIKFACGCSSTKQSDFTAKQFLAIIGYSTQSNSYISRLSEYNKLLCANGLISISKYRDNNGRERNIYSLCKK